MPRKDNWRTNHPDVIRAINKKSRDAHKDRVRETRKRYRKSHPEVLAAINKKYKSRFPERRRNAELRRKYGIDNSDYNAMFVAQEGKCAVCGRRSDAYFCIDHNHQTGKVRGLLCHRCNRGLGLLFDDIEILQHAIDYLGDKT